MDQGICLFSANSNHNHTTNSLARVILRVFALALQVDINYFDDMLKEQAHTLRLLHYPPLSKEVADLAAESGDQSKQATKS